jgi:PAS domain S-box-containing protein
MSESDEPVASGTRLSEARFRAAVAAVGVMWTNDASGRMKGAQPGWAELTGQSEEEYQGYGWALAVHPDDAPATIAAWNQAVAALRMFEFEHRVRRRDGVWRNFSVRAVPVIQDAAILEWVGVHIDITDRARALEDFRASELRSQNILESITDGFFTLDQEWRFDYVNPEAERILDCKPGALLGRVLWEVYPGTVGSAFEQTYRRVAAEKKAESFLAFYPDHGRWYDVRAFPHPTGVSVYFRDVTDAKHSEAALRASEERRRLALDSAELGAWNIDTARQRLIADERFGMIFCGSPVVLDYKQAVAAVHPDDRPRITEAIALATRADHPAPYAVEYRVIHPDGTVHWVFAKGRANFEDVAGERRLVSFDGTVADITARHQSEDDLRKFAADLSEADRHKDEFLATLAHELRNPLAPIRNGLQLMRLSHYTREVVEKTAGMMDRQVRQMVRLVDDLLDVSRVSRDLLQLQKERVTLATVLAQAAETSRPLISSGGHDLVLRAPAEAIELDADSTRLVQVFSNLLTNAAKFSDRGSRIWLTVVTTSEAELTISVRDEGAGISADMLPKIFNMFVQVDRTLERSQGGLGIGLTLVKRIVELHGGSVEARSQGEGLGSEFIVRLPRPVSPGAAATSEGAAQRLSSRFNVLVADDNRDAAETLVDILRLSGNTVQQANDGLEAVALAAKFQPDVIVLDIGMPKLNGYEACRLIREQPWGKKAVMIASTGWGQEEDRRRSKEAGFDHHLVKPIDPDVLERLLGSLQGSAAR